MPSQLVVVLLRFVALLPALTFHEFAHAYSAYRFGDMTPKMQGRVSLNPLNHLDPFGTLMILFGPFGWAKPVQVNPYNFAEPAKQMMLSTAFGPIANLAQGTVCALLLRGYLAVRPLDPLHGSLLVAVLAMIVILNFALAFFNLIPLGPLDGHEVLRYFLPYQAKVSYHRFNSRYGQFCLLGLLLLPWVGGPFLLWWWIQPGLWLGGQIAGGDLYSILGAALLPLVR